ncbi:thioredoxin [Candidatus Dependentiae bacterium]|nr:thioredoxin [Candidatus Dependentiae bacterium]
MELNSSNFEQEVLKSDKPVIIDVFATWCGPCQMMAPIFEEVSKEMADKYKFAKLNIDEERDLAIEYNVSSVPTIIFIKNGKIIGKETGYMDADTLKEKIKNIF